MVHASDLAEAAEADGSSYKFAAVPTAKTMKAYVLAQLERRAAGQKNSFGRSDL